MTLTLQIFWTFKTELIQQVRHLEDIGKIALPQKPTIHNIHISGKIDINYHQGKRFMKAMICELQLQESTNQIMWVTIISPFFYPQKRAHMPEQYDHCHGPVHSNKK